MIVYGAFRSVPDYTARAAPLLSLHETVEGAIAALYPDREDFRQAFQLRRARNGLRVWDGPDGFGEVRELEVLP